MRKTTAEKIQIIENATTDKKIKKLSIQHGITTKTIRRWMKQYANGEFSKQEQKKPIARKVTLKKIKPFQNIVFNVIQMKTPYKGNGKNGFYRFQIKDMDYGFMFAAYSATSDRKIVGLFLTKFIESIVESGYSVKRIVTAKKIHLNGVEKILSDRNIKHEFYDYNDIKKYTSLSLRKNSYMNEKTLYETKMDFLLDSAATVAKNNVIIYEKLNLKTKSIIKFLKVLNIKYHSDIFKLNSKDFDIKSILAHLDKIYVSAVGYHQQYKLDVAGSMYEKLFYVLDKSEYEIDLLVRIVLQRSKGFYLKKDIDRSKELINYTFPLLNYLEEKSRLNYYNTIYMMLCDAFRIEGDEKKSLYYMKRCYPVLKKINDMKKIATHYIDYSILLSNFKRNKLSMQYLKKAQEMALLNNFNDLIPIIDEYYAKGYSSSGKYEEALRLFIKLIKDDVHKDKPYNKSILYGQTGQIYYTLGNLSESIKFYEESIKITEKNKEIQAFLYVNMINLSGKATSLYKMNELTKVKSIFEENISVARENSFTNLVTSNISNLIYIEVDLGNIENAKKLLNELDILLKNQDNSGIKYSYYLTSGILNKAQNKYKKAEKFILKSIETVPKNNDYKNESYFKCKFELIDLYIDMKKLDKAEKLAEETYWETRKTKLKAMRYKAKMLKYKILFFRKDDTSSYLSYLQFLVRKKNYSEEEFYMIRKEFDKYIKQINTKDYRPNAFKMREDYYGLKAN